MFWARKWKRGHWSFNGDTPSRYGAPAGDIAGLAARIPAGHRRFLRKLPWFFDSGRWLFVHAGMEVGPIAPQLEGLRERTTPVCTSSRGWIGGSPPISAVTPWTTRQMPLGIESW